LNPVKNLWWPKLNPPAPPPSNRPPRPVDDENPPFSPSDQQWFDRLRGKLIQADDPPALLEADLLRAAILREHAAEAPISVGTPSPLNTAETPSTSAADQVGAERLMFALRREGLLVSSSELVRDASAAKAKRPAWMMLSGLAASVLVGFFALQALQLGQLPVQYDEPPTMRGQIQNLTVRDKTPKARAEAIAAKLTAAGLSARIYQSREKFIVDTDLIAEKLDAAAKVLIELGIEAKLGQARITVQKPD
jgi:hypothetical protein